MNEMLYKLVDEDSVKFIRLVKSKTNSCFQTLEIFTEILQEDYNEHLLLNYKIKSLIDTNDFDKSSRIIIGTVENTNTTFCSGKYSMTHEVYSNDKLIRLGTYKGQMELFKICVFFKSTRINYYEEIPGVNFEHKLLYHNSKYFNNDQYISKFSFKEIQNIISLLCSSDINSRKLGLEILNFEKSN